MEEKEKSEEIKLNREQDFALRQFEKHLFELGGEDKELKASREPFQSVLDGAGSRENRIKKQASLLDSMISGALKEENLVIDGEDVFEEDDDSGQTAEEEELAAELEEDIIDDETINAIIDEETPPDEEVEDDIEEIEHSEEELKKEVAEHEGEEEEAETDEFSLPEEYWTLEEERLLPPEEVFAVLSTKDSTALDDEDETLGLDELDVELEEAIHMDDAEVYQSARDFSEADQNVFFNNLDKYGVFIRKSVCSIITDEELGFFAQRLVDLVLEQATPQTIQRECEKLLNSNIPVPKDTHIYEAAELREKLFTSGEKFRKTAEVTTKRILPLVAGVALTLFFGFFFVVQPVRAYVNYVAGYKDLENQEYEESEEHFIKAADIWSMKRFYLKYANEYSDQRKYLDAKKKYLQLVFGLDENLRNYLQELTIEENLFSDIFVENKRVGAQESVNFYRKGFLELGKFTRDVEGSYEEARSYYNTWLLKNPDDFRFYIEIANTYISWYDEEGDINLLDQAGASYDKAMLLANGKDYPLIMRLRYSVRAQEFDLKEKQYVDTLQKSVLFAHPENEPETIVVPFMELAEYKLNTGKANYAASFLDKIQTEEPHYPNLDYLYARYYNQIDNRELEKLYLVNAQEKYALEDGLRGNSLVYAIDTDIMLGDYFLNVQGNVLEAKNSLLKAQEMYESSTRLFLISKREKLARLYVLQASIALREHDLFLAKELLVKARQEDYNSPALEYYSGVVNYIDKQYSDAATDFVSLIANYIDVEKDSDFLFNDNENATQEIVSMINSLDDVLDYQYIVDRQQEAIEKNKENIFLAMANSFYFSENYVVAALYYERALQSIEEKRGSLLKSINSIDIKNNSDDYYFFHNIARIKNNLGVALYQLSKSNTYDRTYDKYSEFYSRAIIELQEANVMIQNVRRDADESIRVSLVDLPQRNISAVLKDNAVAIYPDILLTIDAANVEYYNTVAFNQ